ncbi:MAG: zinc transporter ZupT [Clostridiales bacterium]|nr:zinc transporter ZupT [Clostridiales bacterium]
MEYNYVLLAFLLTLFAGLSTGIGGLITFFFRKTNTKLLSVILGFSAGVMIYVSFAELLTEGKKHLEASIGKAAGSWVTVAAFFGGIFLIAIIDKLIPSYENPHESHMIEEMDSCDISDPNKKSLGSVIKNSNKLLRTGLMTALAITIHNFPEGLATFASAINQPSLGIAIALAIAIHNIPEGIAISIPVYCATGSRKKALGLSLLSGLSEPVGAIVGYLILMPFLNEAVFGVLFAAVAGIMIFISLDELLPTAREYGEHHLSMYGLISGMIVMAVSLLLFIK